MNTVNIRRQVFYTSTAAAAVILYLDLSTQKRTILIVRDEQIETGCVDLYACKNSIIIKFRPTARTYIGLGLNINLPHHNHKILHVKINCRNATMLRYGLE